MSIFSYKVKCKCEACKSKVSVKVKKKIVEERNIEFVKCPICGNPSVRIEDDRKAN